MKQLLDNSLKKFKISLNLPTGSFDKLVLVLTFGNRRKNMFPYSEVFK